MKKTIALVLVLALVFTMFAGCGGNDKVIKIGIFEPASGDNGAGGKQEALGIQYANEETPTIELNGETYEIKLVQVDNESDPAKSITAAESLVSQGVSIVLGTYGSACAIAAGPTFDEAGVAAMGVTCTNPQVTAAANYFRICFLDPFQGTVLANYAWENGSKKAYCLSKMGDDYSVGLVNYFSKAFKALGGTVVEEQFEQGNSDFAAYVANAKKNGCDVFFSPVSTEAAALIINQAQAQKLGMPILASDTWDSNVITGAAKGTDLEIIVTTFYQEGGDAEFDKGIKAWIEGDKTNLANNGGNTELAAVTAMGYDAYYVALEAIKAAGSGDQAAVLEALPDVVYTGVCGKVVFTETGDADRSEAVVKKCNTQEGTWEYLGTQTVK
ncbi:MAG: ABC transporter substrate-binding protein [Firmicutes bacterium]|nr:ABC transporter substrate-binding protein [Bacillota bacterium]